MINLRGVSTKFYFNLIFTIQTYKELENNKRRHQKLSLTVFNKESSTSARDLETKQIIFHEKFDNLDRKMDFYLATSATSTFPCFRGWEQSSANVILATGLHKADYGKLEHNLR